MEVLLAFEELEEEEEEHAVKCAQSSIKPKRRKLYRSKVLLKSVHLKKNNLLQKIKLKSKIIEIN